MIVNTGPVASRFTVTSCVVVPPPLVAVQVNVTPAVSVVTEDGPQPEDDPIGDWGSVTDQDTPTSEVYQPAAPRS